MRTPIGGVGALALILLTLSGCATSEFAAVNTEPGYYYGFGSGPTEVAAREAAVSDLVYNTFTESGSIKKERKAKVILTAEMKAALAPLALKPFLAEKKSDTSFTAVYRVKFADWTTAETARLAKLQADLGGRLNALTADTKSTFAARLTEAVRLTRDLDRHGVPLSLRTGGADSPLVADAVVQWAKEQVAGATLRFVPEGGLVLAGQNVEVTLADKTGKPLGGVPLAATWATNSGASVPLAPVTDPKGVANAAYPAEETFKNVKSSLKVSTRIGSLVPESTFLSALDGGLTAEASFRNAVLLVPLKVEEAKVEGGTYTVGSVKQDRRAGSNEKPRTATVKTFYIDLTPVTNAQYQSFLVATDVPKAQWPDFIEAGDLSGADQPVVGVTWAEANRYAEWASGILGVKKRLPTEDEYEIAARAGLETIFPWGDQSPTDGVRANYSGNKKFTSTSPVGSFANGKNSWGLADAVGNVWQWTSTGPDASMSADPSFKLVKGGSWIDGPNELRISNRRAVDPAEGTSDIGFRLVREENQ